MVTTIGSLHIPTLLRMRAGIAGNQQPTVNPKGLSVQPRDIFRVVPQGFGLSLKSVRSSV